MSRIQIKRGSQNTIGDKCRMLILNKGYFALVDKTDYDWLVGWTWKAKRASHCYYAVRKSTHYGKTIQVKMHRAITQCPKDKVVHHRNGDSLDNRRVNLKVCSPEEHHLLHKEI